jgi:hypothetical protein
MFLEHSASAFDPSAGETSCEVVAELRWAARLTAVLFEDPGFGLELCQGLLDGLLRNAALYCFSPKLSQPLLELGLGRSESG